MSMHEAIQHGMNAKNPWLPLLVIPVAVVVGGFLVSRLSGWGLLARRFRASEPFEGESWSWQSARFRGWCGYNNCLRVGASPEGLFLAVAWPFRLFHAPLMIPWREIEVEQGKALFGLYDTAQLRIGV